MQFVSSVLTSETNPHAALRCLHNMMSLSRQEFLRSSEPLRLPLVAAAAATTATATACIAAAATTHISHTATAAATNLCSSVGATTAL